MAIVNAHKALVKTRARLLAKEGLSLPQFGILKVIANKGPMLMRRLSREMLVTPPNITGIIDRLEKRNLVRRVAGTEDRRASVIELTKEGKNHYQTLAKAQRILIQNVLSALTPDEQVILSTLLTKLRDEILRRERIDR